MSLLLVEREISVGDSMPAEYLQPVKALWEDRGIKMAIAKGNEYALHDNLE